MKITLEVTIEELERLFGEKTEEKETSGRYECGPIDCSVWFNQDCAHWSTNPERNTYFLMSQQDYFNDLLRNRGHLYLNEVYDALGIPRTKAGQLVGWVYDEKNPIGDNYVDFGIDEERNQDFANGKTPNALLVFNVDGIIIDKI